MKKVILSFLLVSVLAFAVFGQTPNSPNDFQIANSSLGGVRITKYVGTRQDVVIPSTIDGMRVTEIGARSFYGNLVASDRIAVRITSVVFPNTLVAIGNAAFSGQPLTSISLPSSLRRIRTQAFYGTSFSSVVIPNGVTYIGDQAFGRGERKGNSYHFPLPGT